MAAKTFEEWIHDGLENEHVPTDSHGWLRRAWEAATKAAEERFTSHNSAITPPEDRDCDTCANDGLCYVTRLKCRGYMRAAQ